MNGCSLCVVWKGMDVSGVMREGLHTRVGTSGVGVGGTMEILTDCVVGRCGVACTPVLVVRASSSGDSVVTVTGIKWSRLAECCFATRRRPPGFVYETAMRRGMGGGQHADLAE